MGHFRRKWALLRSRNFKIVNSRMLKSKRNFFGFKRPNGSWGPKERFGRLKPKKVVLRFEQSQIHYFEIRRSAIMRDDDFHEFMKTTILDFIVLGHQKSFIEKLPPDLQTHSPKRQLYTGFDLELPLTTIHHLTSIR